VLALGWLTKRSLDKKENAFSDLKSTSDIMMAVVKCIILFFAMVLTIRHPAVYADEGGLRFEEDRTLDLMGVARKLDRAQLAAPASNPPCKSYTAMFAPQYKECSIDNSTLVLRQSLGFTKSDLCVHFKGLPCRASYVCPAGSVNKFYMDCRNLVKPGTKCAGVDCNDNCLPYPATRSKYKFSYAKNTCGRMGWNCIGTYYDIAGCYWNSYLPGGQVVRVNTDEPYNQIGQPNSLGYFGMCFPTVNGKKCKSCKIDCMFTGGNYAQFDCSNLITSTHAKLQCPA
jgi:hypothetical protein